MHTSISSSSPTAIARALCIKYFATPRARVCASATVSHPREASHHPIVGTSLASTSSNSLSISSLVIPRSPIARLVPSASASRPRAPRKHPPCSCASIITLARVRIPRAIAFAVSKHRRIGDAYSAIPLAVSARSLAKRASSASICRQPLAVTPGSALRSALSSPGARRTLFSLCA